MKNRFEEAVANREAKIIIELLATGAITKEQIDKQDNRGFTALMLAVHDSQATVVSSLLDRGADVRLTSNSSETALTLASFYNDFAIKFAFTSRGYIS